MTNFDKTWEDFSQMLLDSDLTEKQKYWLLLKLQSLITKEISCAENTVLNINSKLDQNKRIDTKPDKKIKAEKEVAKNYINSYQPMHNFLTVNCKEIITEQNELSPTEQNELLESIDSPYQCDNSNTRKKIRKILCGFDTNAKCRNITKKKQEGLSSPVI